MVRRVIAAGLYRKAAQAMDRRGATQRDLRDAYVALHLALRLEPDMDVARRELGAVCLLLGLPNEALQHADDRVEQGKRACDADMRGSGLVQRGEVLEAAGRHAEAAEVFRGALALLDADDPAQDRTYWVALSDMGAALMRAGQFAEAYAMQHEAYNRAIRASRHECAAMDAAQLALLSTHLSQPERAVEWAQEAIDQLRGELSPLPVAIAEVYGNRSLALSAIGRHEEAADSAAEARPLVAGSPVLSRQMQLTSATVANEAGRYDDAAAQLGELLADPQADLATRAIALSGRAVVRMKQGSPVQAISDLNESLRLRRELGDQRGLAVTVSNLVRAHLEASAPAEAARYADESERLWTALADDAPDEPGRAGLAELITPVVSQNRQELCLASGDLTGALVAAERGRQGPLTRLLQSAHPDVSVPAEPPGADRIRDLARRLNATVIAYSVHMRTERQLPVPTWITQLCSNVRPGTSARG